MKQEPDEPSTKDDPNNKNATKAPVLGKRKLNELDSPSLPQNEDEAKKQKTEANDKLHDPKDGAIKQENKDGENIQNIS